MSFTHWIQAARPRTLVAAAIPVATAAMIFRLHSVGYPGWLSDVLGCTVFALLAQVISNLANDLGDGQKGTDQPGRIGPPRAVAEGRISPRAMTWGIAILVLLALAVGFATAGFNPWLVAAGILALVLALGYTLGPFPLAYVGLGDVFVVACFGIQATVLTGYILWNGAVVAMPETSVSWPLLGWDLAWAGLGIGLLADNILLSNNARDRLTDDLAGKRTTVVRFGLGFARQLHGFNLVLGIGALSYVFGWPPLLLIPLAIRDHWGFRAASEPIEFVPFLGRSALLLLLAGLLCITGACLGWSPLLPI